MALSWFKKKKAKQEGAEGTQQSPEVVPETLNAEDAPRSEVLEQNNGSASENIENETVPPTDPDEPETDLDVPEKSGGFFKRLKSGLSKTRKLLSTDINELFAGNRKIDDELLEDLEELLITSDIGVQTTEELMDSISRKSSKISGPDELKAVLKEKILEFLRPEPPTAGEICETPHVIMVIGVNGVGKTTTIGKLAAKAASSGKR